MSEIAVYTTVYEPWEDGADERERRSASVTTFDCTPDDCDVIDGLLTPVDVAIKTLRGLCFTQYSATGWQRHGWYSTEPYEHPYDGTLEDKSAHLNGFTEDERRQIYRALLEPAVLLVKAAPHRWIQV